MCKSPKQQTFLAGYIQKYSNKSTIQFVLLLFIWMGCISTSNQHDQSLKCKDLKVGQYFCDDPVINHETQQAAGCAKDSNGNYTVQVSCYPVEGLVCDGVKHTGHSIGFNKTVACKWTNNYSFKTSLLLSIFLGMFGVDRFYLGYPALGLLKFCTLGFAFLGQMVDMLLIATQVVGPADGSHYVMDFYGPGIEAVARNNQTYYKPQYTA